MARQLFLQPHLSPTIEKLERYEFAKIWASTSYHLSLQLALHQAVRIPGIGTFAVVRKRVALSEQDLVIVERPVFRPDKAVVQDYELRYGCKDFPGHQDFEQLPYAEIASENAVSEGTVQLYMERTTHLFHAYLENRKNVAIIWRDVGMLIAEGKEIKKRFYLHFLERLNGAGKMLQALLEMPEMRDSVISRHDTAASQTSSGRVIVLPWCQLETVPKMPTLIDLTGRVQGKGDGSGKKGRGPVGCWQGAAGFPSTAHGGDQN
ncbi:coiled-coil domain-containing protein 81-like [Patagioenas fasciata]|uniref:coiled-coil domain-containing protein 81-like n=1 Tax=Patagioenas fasciata TaxID=372321 RepID=UPI003A9A5B2D